MQDRAKYVAARLAEQAEAVCRHYLSSGHRSGHYWLVGDADNSPGRSLFVRLKSGDTGKPAGKWTDFVALEVMLRSGAVRRSCEGSAASRQHNLSSSGRVA